MALFDRKDVIPVIVLIAVAIAAVIGIGIFLHTTSRSAYAAEPVFDHSNCQYPNRLSNPVNGCDNSDPARPECMKDGTEDCSIVKDDTQPIFETETPPAASPAVKISNCKE